MGLLPVVPMTLISAAADDRGLGRDESHLGAKRRDAWPDTFQPA